MNNNDIISDQEGERVDPSSLRMPWGKLRIGEERV